MTLALLCLLGGLVLIAVGFLLYFAGMMSDAGGGNVKTSNTGCGIALLGLILLIICARAMVES